MEQGLAFVPSIGASCHNTAVASHDPLKTVDCVMPVHVPSSPSPPCGISPYNSGDRLLLMPRGLVSCAETDDGVGSTETTVQKVSAPM